MNRHRTDRSDAGDRHQPLHLRTQAGPGTDLPVKLGDLFGQGRNLRQQQIGHRHNLCGKRLPRHAQLQGKLLQPPDTLWRHHTELGQLAPERVDRLRALPDQERAGAEQSGIGLCLLRFHRNEPHGRALHRLDDCSRIIGIILLTLQKGLDTDRRDQLARMAKANDLTTPMMRTAAGLHNDPAWRNLGHKRQEPSARQLPLENRLSPGGGSMKLEAAL